VGETWANAQRHQAGAEPSDSGGTGASRGPWHAAGNEGRNGGAKRWNATVSTIGV